MPERLRWWERRMCCFDTETTSSDPLVARIVSAAVVHVGADLDTVGNKWLLNPGVPIPAETTKIHGITDELVQREGMEPAVALAQILGALDTAWNDFEPAVIFNAPYDLTVLSRELERYGIPGARVGKLVGPVIDPLVLDRHIDLYRKGGRKLEDLVKHYDARLDTAHDAFEDALAAARVAWRIGRKKHKDIEGKTLSELHEAQVIWYREQMEGLARYWKLKNDPRTVDSYEWPVRLEAKQLPLEGA